MNSNLTNQVLEFKKTGKGYPALNKNISMLAYTYPRKRLCYSPDIASTFFLHFYPKIPYLISRFNYQGISFESFLLKTIRLQCRTIAKWTQKKEQKTKIIFNPSLQIYKCYHTDTEPEKKDPPCIHIDHILKRKKITKKAMIRRILYLLLKECNSVAEDKIKAFSNYSGYDEIWLKTSIEHMKALTWHRNRKLTALIYKKNHALTSLTEKELYKNTEHTPHNQTHANRIVKLHRRLKRVSEKLSNKSIQPSNSEIAAFLGIPKGSVDSGLYYIRNHFKKNA